MSGTWRCKIISTSVKRERGRERERERREGERESKREREREREREPVHAFLYILLFGDAADHLHL